MSGLPAGRSVSRLCVTLAIVGLGVATSACEPPASAAVVRCSGSNLADVAVKKDCSVTVRQFSSQTAATIRVDTKRRHAFVKGDFTVQQGTVRIELRGATGTEAEITVTPDSPGTVESTLRLNRANSDFIIRFHPEGEVSGLAGNVQYEAR